MRHYAIPVAVLITAVAITGSPAGAQHTTPTADIVAKVMAKEVSDGFSGTVLVVERNKIVVQAGYGLRDRKANLAMTPDTLIDAGSIGKQVTAALAVKMVSEGRIALSDTLGKYFPDAPADKAKITLRQLLSHSSGLEGWIFPDDFTMIPREEWVRRVLTAPLLHPTGTRYLYSNDGITLVAMALEKAAGKSFQEMVRERFFVPLKMDRTGWYDDLVVRSDTNIATGYLNNKPDGSPAEWPGPYWALLGNGGIVWSPSDLLTWHRALHGNFFTQAERKMLFTPVIAETEEDAPAPSVASIQPPLEGQPLPLDTGYYAQGWSVRRDRCGGHSIGHNGSGISHNASYLYFPDRDILIYVASNLSEKDYTGNQVKFSVKAGQALVKGVFGC